MKRIQRFAAVNVIAALMAAGIPAMAAQHDNDVHNRGGMQHQSADQRGARGWNGNSNRNIRSDDSMHRERRDYGSNYRDDRGYVAATPVYSAPVYSRPVYSNGYYDSGYYDSGYYDNRSHNGRTAAIIGGSAAAGAVIGAVVGHGQGAAIGAVVGGVAGAIASAAADHHDRR
jgi:hypothetical protein